MEIKYIPKEFINVLSYSYCYELSVGETISQETAEELVGKIGNFIMTEGTDTDVPESGAIDYPYLISMLGELVPILDQLMGVNVDRLSLSIEYRAQHSDIVRVLMDEIGEYDNREKPLDREAMRFLNFIPVTEGYAIPAYLAKGLPDEMIVYNCETDEETTFGEIRYNEPTDMSGLHYGYYCKA